MPPEIPEAARPEILSTDQELAKLPLKERLECQRVIAETDNLRKPYYRTPGFYGATLPILLALAGLVYSWSSGWFDVQQKKLDAQRIMLEFDIKQLEVKKSEQQTLLDSLKADRATLRNRLDQLTATNSILEANYDLLGNQKNQLQNLVDGLTKQVRNLAGAETNKQALVENVLALQRQVRELTATNASLLARLSLQPRAPPQVGGENVNGAQTFGGSP
jgi:hypothetical protein